MALESMLGSDAPLLALVWSTLGQTVENVAVRWSMVLVTCTRVSDGDGGEFYLHLVLLEGRNEGGVLFGLICVFLVASMALGESSLYEKEGA